MPVPISAGATRSGGGGDRQRVDGEGEEKEGGERALKVSGGAFEWAARKEGEGRTSRHVEDRAGKRLMTWACHLRDVQDPAGEL